MPGPAPGRPAPWPRRKSGRSSASRRGCSSPSGWAGRRSTSRLPDTSCPAGPSPLAAGPRSIPSPCAGRRSPPAPGKTASCFEAAPVPPPPPASCGGFPPPGGEAHPLPAQQKGGGDGRHLHHLLVIVEGPAPVGRVVRVGAVHQPLPKQGKPLRSAPGGPQGAQPPQHPGEALHPGGVFPVVGGVSPQLQSGIPGGKAAPYRLQELQKSPFHVLPGAQGVLTNGQIKARHDAHPFRPLVAMP